jgi:hypothetical protein
MGFVNGHTLFFPTDSNIYPNQMTVVQLFIAWHLEMSFVVVITILRVMCWGRGLIDMHDRARKVKGRST